MKIKYLYNVSNDKVIITENDLTYVNNILIGNGFKSQIEQITEGYIVYENYLAILDNGDYIKGEKNLFTIPAIYRTDNNDALIIYQNGQFNTIPEGACVVEGMINGEGQVCVYIETDWQWVEPNQVFSPLGLNEGVDLVLTSNGDSTLGTVTNFDNLLSSNEE